jgi:hypothetical protein
MYTELKQDLEYNPDTGEFRWLRYVSPTCSLSWFKGKITNGYYCIGYKGKTWRAHRLAWLLMTGDFPLKEIDHLDRDRGNNKWENLRDTSRTLNQYNKNKCKNKYTSMYPGVRLHKPSGKYTATVCYKNQKYHVGYYTCEKEAYKAYLDKQLEFIKKELDAS